MKWSTYIAITTKLISMSQSSPTRATLLTGRDHNRYYIWHTDAGGLAKEDLTCPSLFLLPSPELLIAEILSGILET